MKLSELKPCDGCGGVLMPDHAGCWNVVRISPAFIKPQAAREVMGLSMMFGGALGLAEVMAPDSQCVLIAGDEEPKLLTEIHVCVRCMMIPLAELIERAERRKADREGAEVSA